MFELENLIATNKIKVQNFKIVDNFKTAGGTYSGQINSDGDRHGIGRMLPFTQTFVYEGEHKNGERTGFGRLVANDGETYIGYWKDGLKHGQGKYTFAKGQVQEGIW